MLVTKLRFRRCFHRLWEKRRELVISSHLVRSGGSFSIVWIPLNSTDGKGGRRLSGCSVYFRESLDAELIVLVLVDTSDRMAFSVIYYCTNQPSGEWMQ